MATEENPAKPPLTSAPEATIHEAELDSGPSGGVIRGVQIDFGAAVARRRIGDNVVVCGDDATANRRLAERIESVIGPCQRQDPHDRRAEPQALPHYQQLLRHPPPPEAHTFYETTRRKARKRA